MPAGLRGHYIFCCAVLAMAIALSLSNRLVNIQINDWLTWAAFTYPVIFLIVDLSNRILGIKKASQVVAWGFLFGILLSFASAPMRIAIASGSAFLIGGILNLLIFDRLRQAKQWWRAPAISSALASISDSFIFFALAFAGTQVPWQSLALGDLGVKLMMLVLFLPVYKLIMTSLSPERVPA